MTFDWDKYAEYVKSSIVLDVDTDERCALLDLHERVKALEGKGIPVIVTKTTAHPRRDGWDRYVFDGKSYDQPPLGECILVPTEVKP